MYSTCSIYQEENEWVVKDLLKMHGKKWKTVDLSELDIGMSKKFKKGFHFNIGKAGNSLRICSSCGPKNYLNGFFLCLFERN